MSAVTEILLFSQKMSAFTAKGSPIISIKVSDEIWNQLHEEISKENLRPETLSWNITIGGIQITRTDRAQN